MIEITFITVGKDGEVFGLGADNKLYLWHHSGEHASSWVLYVVNK
jgi:hypothetical protein